ncbi:hypothetical protein M408DRAFT_24950 [Serendipita vermifera MAFF 305830]|uniref:Crinkler effector protein N-terminal domain-containing protein n=1 Tax=Serendipita vermifera MAFF 305830 TaxID=933852 RepID=A0A0C2XCT1_SERVB|nr:hypothetical protein M408DRAFT_24950 [Serendipita vermifera MAFF 305830]
MTPFPVGVEASITVGELKREIIKENHNDLGHIDPYKLTLYKVNIADDENLVKNMVQKVSANIPPLNVTMALSELELYPSIPPPGTIHISVQLPPNSTARRNLTVDALYKRLNRYHFVLVRGTSASGKSTLAQLLYNHIRTKEPTTDPILTGYLFKEECGWLANLKHQCDYNPNGPNVVIIDGAQTSYEDLSFWEDFLKPIGPQSLGRVILFTSYGILPNRVTTQGIPIIVPYHQQGFPSPQPNSPIWSTGSIYPGGRFTQDFLDYVFHVTAGHVGAVYDWLGAVMEHESYHALKPHNGEYSLEIFQTQFPISEFWSALDKRSTFRGALPTRGHLSSPELSRLFRAVLSNNYGFVEYYLGNQAIGSTLIKEHSLSDFAINVIRLFSHLQLSSPRRVSASNTHRPPEARFQDEFYRCCLDYSNGSLISFPGSGYENGRVDLYIPQKEWGLRLLRDGDTLENSSSRFAGPGAYAKMTFNDYIILDFRQTQPQESYPELTKLYHVIFESDYKNVHIRLGSSLEKIAEFELVN